MATKKTESSVKQTKSGANSTKTTTTKAPTKKPEASVDVETVKSARTAVLEAPQAKNEKEIASARAIKETKKQITLDHIATRAYLLWQERGCGHGNDVNDWLRAEAELSERN